MDEQHPALIAARNSWRCVQAKLRDEWLDLMADDILIEDPIGIGPTNPTGKGQRGREAAAAFWDQNIEPSTIQIEIHESCAAGLESAHLMTLRARLANGIQTAVRGIFTYRVDEAGKLDRLRGYWTLDAMKFERTQTP